jgi:hypothetical protein
MVPGCLLALALGADVSPAGAFLSALQRAVARHDRAAVAGLFEYPAMIITSGARIPVLDRASMARLFAVAFPPEMQGVVAMARLSGAGGSAPEYRVTVAGDSLTIGRSLIWAHRTGGRYRIVRIMVPSGWVTIGAASAPAPPQRILVRPGQSALFSGTLRPFEVQSYVITVGTGQRLQLRLDGFAGRDVVMRVVDRRTGIPVDAAASDGTRVWSTQVIDAADYRIDVVRLAPEGKPQPLYVLAVTLR